MRDGGQNATLFLEYCFRHFEIEMYNFISSDTLTNYTNVIMNWRVRNSEIYLGIWRAIELCLFIWESISQRNMPVISQSERVNTRTIMDKFGEVLICTFWHVPYYKKNPTWLHYCVFQTLPLSVMVQVTRHYSKYLTCMYRLECRSIHFLFGSPFRCFRIPASNSIVCLYWLLAVIQIHYIAID